MMGNIQDGIYYDKPLGNSFCLLFLKISKSVHSSDLAKDLSELWKVYDGLKIGKLNDLDINTNHHNHGNLSVLIGYSPKIFDGIVLGLKKKKPNDLIQEKGFRGPIISPGEAIAFGSGINFSRDIIKNHALENHIIIQFIADYEMFTNRAIVETWKYIKKRQNPILNISNFYTGFKRSDQRGWLGFHEGVSNIPKKDREDVIAIKQKSVSNQDKWLENGSYMAFIRFIIDLEKWESLRLHEQEIIIGRKKTTGCPLIGFDKNGNPIGDPDCPIPGTNEVIEDGNEKFREHKPADEKNISSPGMYKSLSTSHIYKVHKSDNHNPEDFRSFRIFRQGFEFLESYEKHPGFRVGLNFVSFQNKPQNVMKILTLPQWLGRSVNTNVYGKVNGLESFISARAAGIFLIPPFIKNESFPGSVMFS
jgi:Dyp-type peroxidase family